MYGYIYKTVNLVNDKVYIGRRRGDFTKKYLGSGFILKRAINKDGEGNFRVEVIAYADSEEMLNNLERAFIRAFRIVYGHEALYNIADGGQGGNIFGGRAHSEASRIKMSISRKGIPKSLAWKKKMSKICQGHSYRGLIHHSQETKDRLRIALINREFSEDTKRRMSISAKGRHPVTEFKKGMHNSRNTEFKKGHIPWSKGLKLSSR